MASFEVERKFLVSELPPDLDSCPASEIVQGYLAIEPDGTEVRVRRRGGEPVLTVKRGRGRTRREEEVELVEAQFEHLWPLTEGRRIEKTRYEVRYDGDLVIELDVYHGALAGLITAEIEFRDERAAEGFAPPAWLGPEVTDDPVYKNQHLAVHGRPPVGR
jgi:CYTH domain-containing protein